MRLHAFVVMPFGVKKDSQGTEIDFNRVYVELFKPALEAAGLVVFRADQEQRAGDIRVDMFQELLIADLVLADLTLENPNVWYELGARHALRARGVMLACAGRVTSAFDLYTDRKLRYSIINGGPDPALLEEDKQNITNMALATMECWHGRKISPIYQLMPNLQEPDWKSLRIGNVREFWAIHDDWEGRIRLARKAGNIGDILVLADEAPVSAFRADAWIKAGEALRKAECFSFALEQLDKGLLVEPDNITGLQEKGICLQRLALAGSPGHSLDRAREHYRNILRAHPHDPETWALLGRLDKDAWIAAWCNPEYTPEQMRYEATYEDALLCAAVDSYATGYRHNPAHYYSGINALTLMHLHRHLTGNTRFDCEIDAMSGAVRFAASCEMVRLHDFWSHATIGDLEVLIGTPEKVTTTYKEAIAKNDKDWFALRSCQSQLQVLRRLDFKPENVNAGLSVFERALRKLDQPAARWQPRQVFLFSGHMIDAPGRTPPRFPSAHESLAARKIAAALEQLGAGTDDLALTQGACGGDILFTEACLTRGVKVRWLQPYNEADFIRNSVTHGGEAWWRRYLEAKAGLAGPIRAAPVELGEPPPDAGLGYPYQRCNLWLLYTALAFGSEKVRFICLWNGEDGDGPGGTAHMYEEVRHRTGHVIWIDIRKL